MESSKPHGKRKAAAALGDSDGLGSPQAVHKERKGSKEKSRGKEKERDKGKGDRHERADKDGGRPPADGADAREGVQVSVSFHRGQGGEACGLCVSIFGPTDRLGKVHLMVSSEGVSRACASIYVPC